MRIKTQSHPAARFPLDNHKPYVATAPMDFVGSKRENMPEAEMPPSPVEDAVRLYFIDCAMQHLMRQAGMLGLGANATQQALRSERDQIVKRLQALGHNEAFAA